MTALGFLKKSNDTNRSDEFRASLELKRHNNLDIMTSNLLKDQTDELS